MHLSAVIITYNEEQNIRRCIESVQGVADEIVVVDSYSTDGTERICREMGVVFLQHAFEGHIEQKNYALNQAGSDYILSVDADEALSDTLRQSILAAKNHWEGDGYACNRLTSYCGQWIRHCGWYPDTKIRLWDRRRGQWGGTNPHDKVVMNDGCRIRPLKGDLLHYSYRHIGQQIAQINSFSDLAARAAQKEGRRASFIKDILLNPVLTFFKMYLLQLGFLDGYYGFLVCVNSSFGRFVKYTKLRELNRRRSD